MASDAAPVSGQQCVLVGAGAGGAASMACALFERGTRPRLFAAGGAAVFLFRAASLEGWPLALVARHGAGAVFLCVELSGRDLVSRGLQWSSDTGPGLAHLAEARRMELSRATAGGND